MMNGCLIPQTPIAVDFWKVRECPHARIFFLTHLHGDHVTGLTSSWNYPVYCSEITGKLLVERYGVREELIHTLQIDCAQIIYLDSERCEQMTVTAIDANHCPGAVMFLMEGYFGTILHTGDFRFHEEMISDSVLSRYSGRIDTLYLDNTYCSPGCVFPSREEAVAKVIEIVSNHPNDDVLIGLRSLGKEDLLCKIALHFQERISVPESFYRTLELLGAPDVFDFNGNEHRIRVVPFQKVSNRFVNKVNEDQSTIVILPTALYQGIEASPYENNDKVYIVPYSDHSSYTELQEFVSKMKPKKIIPIVKGSSRGPFGLSFASRADMSCFNNCLADGWNSKIDIPKSVEVFMYSKGKAIHGKKLKGVKRKSSDSLTRATKKKMKPGVIYNSPVSNSPLCIVRGGNSSETVKNQDFSDTAIEGTLEQNSKVTVVCVSPIKRQLFVQDFNKRKTAGVEKHEVLKEKSDEENTNREEIKSDSSSLHKELSNKTKGLESPADAQVVRVEERDEMSDDEVEYVISIPAAFDASKVETTFDEVIGTKTYRRLSVKRSRKYSHVVQEVKPSSVNHIENGLGRTKSFDDCKSAKKKSLTEKKVKNSVRLFQDTDSLLENKSNKTKQKNGEDRYLKENFEDFSVIVNNNAHKKEDLNAEFHQDSSQGNISLSNRSCIKQATLEKFFTSKHGKNSKCDDVVCSEAYIVSDSDEDSGKNNSVVENGLDSSVFQDDREIYIATKLNPEKESANEADYVNDIPGSFEDQACIGSEEMFLPDNQNEEDGVADTGPNFVQTCAEVDESSKVPSSKHFCESESADPEVEQPPNMICGESGSSNDRPVGALMLHSNVDSETQERTGNLSAFSTENPLMEENDASLLVNIGTQLQQKDEVVSADLVNADNVADIIQVDSESTEDTVDLCKKLVVSKQDKLYSVTDYQLDYQKNSTNFKNLSVEAVKGTQRVDEFFGGDTSDESGDELNKSSQSSTCNPELMGDRTEDKSGEDNVDLEAVLETDDNIVKRTAPRCAENKTVNRKFCRKCEMEAFEQAFDYFDKMKSDFKKNPEKETVKKLKISL